MASPQKEDGYTPIANEILRALAKHVISPDEWRILMIIFWKTYGWGKKEDRISLSQFEELTKIKRTHAGRAIRKLLKRRMIYKTVTRSGHSDPNRSQFETQTGHSQVISYGIQKDYDLWCDLDRSQSTETHSGHSTVTRSGLRVCPDQVNTKESITKEKDLNTLMSSIDGEDPPKDSPPEKPKKTSSKTLPDEDSDAYHLSCLLFQKIRERKPNFREPNLRAWSTWVDKLLRLEGRTAKSIENVIVWCQKDDFWQNNILSTEKLRKQIDQLELKMEKETGVAPYRKAEGGPPGTPPKNEMIEKMRMAEKELQKEKEEIRNLEKEKEQIEKGLKREK